MSNRLRSPESPAAGVANRVTLRDLAETLDMTMATVSRALSGKGRISASTRQRVLLKAAELGYEANVQAQQLRTQTNNTIAIFSRSLDLGVATMKVELLQRALIGLGYEAAIYSAGFGRPHADSDEQAILASIRRQRPRALICLDVAIEEPCAMELARYQAHGGTLIMYGSQDGLDCDRVYFSERMNTYLAAKHLSDLGHTRIGLFAHGHLAPRGERLDGFREALADAGLDVCSQWLLHGGVDDVYERCGFVLAEQFLRLEERPSAVCIVNDVSAASFVHQMLRAGLRVPEDVSVVGTDNLLAAQYCLVPLTTVSHATEETAAAMIEMLLSRLDGSYDGPTRQRTLTGELIVRASTCAPHNGTRSADAAPHVVTQMPIGNGGE